MKPIYYEVLMDIHVGADYERRQNVYVCCEHLNDSNLSDRLQELQSKSHFIEEGGHTKVVGFSKLSDEEASESLNYKAISLWQV